MQFFQFIADHIETEQLFREDRACQELIMEAMKYHLLPERRPMLQSSRTRPRKSTVGILYAVGGMDANKSKFTITSNFETHAVNLFQNSFQFC